MRTKIMRKCLADSRFAAYADLIESQARPCLRFDAIPTDEGHLPLGSSKLGGSPDLPPGTSWPSYGIRLLDFLAQIDLQDLDPYAFCRVLPSPGHLYFFLNASGEQEGFDPFDRSNWRVIFHPTSRDGLERLIRPALGLGQKHFNPCRIVFHEALSPGWSEIPIQFLGLTEDQIDDYQAVIERLPAEMAHQILGTPGYIEDMEYSLQLECQFMSHGLMAGENGNPLDMARARDVEPGAVDWRLLLQLDSDEGAGMDWGDSMISFWMKEKDLRERNFSEVWMVWEWF